MYTQEQQEMAELTRATEGFDENQRPIMLVASAICPGLRQLSATCPALAYMLAHYREFVACVGDRPWRPVAQRIGWRRRDLLEWLGWDPREASVHLVSKVAMSGITVEDLIKLRTISTTLGADKRLRHLRTITPEVIRILDHPRMSDLAPYTFLEEISEFKPDLPVSSQLAEVIELADLRGIPLRRMRDYKHLAMQRMFLREREYGMLSSWSPDYESVEIDPPPSAPTIPRFTQPAGVHLEPFLSARDLYEWSCAERNCAFSMIEEVSEQRLVMFKVFAPARGTISLAPVDDSWRIYQYFAARNRRVPRSALLAVAAYLNKRLERVDTPATANVLDG